jgi:CHAT domain-containing protein/tetratricopeptide (TPR) repeat protein
MTAEQLVAHLLILPGGAECRAWLESHREVIDLAFIEALKVHAEEYRLRDTPRALEIAGLAQEAASLAEDPDPRLAALASWTMGNVLMYAADFRGCAEAYRAAEPAYAARGDHLSVARLQTNRVFALTNLGRQQEALELAEKGRRGLLAAGQENSRFMAVLDMNVGVACRQAGRFEEALAAYEHGRDLFETLGDPVQMARMDINRAKVLEKLDRFREAGSLLEHARAVLSDHNVALDVARADLNLAHLAFRRGRYREALSVYIRAREGFAALDNETEVASVDFYRAQVYLALNLFAEAYELAGHGRQVFAELEMTRYAIQATAIQAAAARGQGDLAPALVLFTEARSGLQERGEGIEVAFLDLQLAALLGQDGQHQAALDTARSAAETLGHHGISVRHAQSQLLQADCLFDLGRRDEAALLYDDALAVAEGEGLPALAYRARYGQGRVAEAGGDDETAARRYEAAIASIEAIHHDLGVDEFQASFLDDKLEMYEAAVRLALRRGEVETAFGYVERAKAGALLDLLARGVELCAEHDELLERVQALREEWHWHFSRLEGHGLDDQDETTRSGEPGLWSAVRDVEQRLSEAWRQLRLQRWEGAAARHPALSLAGKPQLGLAEVQARLPEDVALLEYWAMDQQLVVFVLRRRQAQVVYLDTTASEVEDLIGTWRFDLDSYRLVLPELSPGEAAALEADGQIPLQKLYQVLVDPLSACLAGCQQLIVVPHQVLHYLPLVALHDGQRYLVERFQISTLPTASLLPDRRLKPQGDESPSIPLVLAYSGEGRLAHVLDEAQQVGMVLDRARVFVENDATEGRLREYAATCGLLHLATHGAFRSDNPLFSWLRLADARLTVHDVYGLNLSRVALVTLSACETGLGDLRGGDLLGLSQSFLAAGAQSLLLSLWAVDDASTSELMVAFYRRLAEGQAGSKALQQAQGEMQKRYLHPFHWAGFVLLGKSGKLISEKPKAGRMSL